MDIAYFGLLDGLASYLAPSRVAIFALKSKGHLMIFIRKYTEVHKPGIVTSSKRFPKTKSSMNLPIASTNWSPVFTISARGILEFLHVALYVNSWAKISIRFQIFNDTWSERLRNMKTKLLHFIDKLFDNNQLCIFNHRMNVVLSFDRIKSINVFLSSYIFYFYEIKDSLLMKLTFTDLFSIFTFAQERSDRIRLDSINAS